MKFLTALAVTAAIITAAFSVASEANAAATCYPYDGIVEQTAKKYDEAPVVTFTAANGNLVVIFTNPKGDSVTMGYRPVTNPNLFCLMATGSDFVLIAGAVGVGL